MATKIRKISHLCLLNLLVITEYVRVIEMTPLCGRTHALSSSSSSTSSSSSSSGTKNTDKIYFLDQQQTIHTEEINGTIVSCFADGTIINATSKATASDSDGSGLKSRIENGKYKISSEFSMES